MIKTHNSPPRGRTSGLGKLTVAVMAMLLAFHFQSLQAQTYAPLRYWTFENSNSMKDSMNNFNMDPNYYGSPYAINNNAPGVGVGKYLTLNGSSGLIKLGELQIDSAFTFEFLFRPGYQFNMSTFFRRIDGAIETRMGYPYISFTTVTNNYGGGTTNDEMMINLNQIGRRSYGYFMDGNWHHIVFRYNSKSGLKQVWVDGECPDGYSKTLPTGYFTNNTSVNREMILNTQSTYLKYHGDYDEMAIYNYSLPNNQIYKHYQNFVAKQHYTYTLSSTPPPTPAPVSAAIDSEEYAPGHPSVTVSTSDQVRTFPIPRYKTGHTLLPNIPLYGVEYLGGLLQSGTSYTQALNAAKIQQVDLINNFNQSILVASNTHEYPYYNDTTKFAGWFIKYANDNPSKHTSAFTFWPQVNPQIIGRASNEPYVTCNCLSNNHYLRNSSGQFLNTGGGVTSAKTLSPAAPSDSLAYDGLTQRYYLQQMVNKLTRPMNLLFENGEVIPFYNNSSVLSMDPAVVSDKNSTGLDWYTYEGRRAKEKVLAYRNQFMNIPQLSNTKFAYYQVDGQPTWRFNYAEMRQTSTQINGQYYPTGDIYVRYPDNWRYWTSAWHGWQWVVESRKVELALGDKLYSPPVAAGWDVDETKNVRPAQWLGLLKAFAMTGAEYFYPSFFSTVAPFQDSKNWAWQTVMPAYAQAVTSRYEDLLRNGYLMEGDVPNDYINPAWNAYSFKTGDLRKLVVIRKHNTLAKYAITGTLQPNSNMMGNAENEGVATITLDGQTLKFKVRRQGSTYIYDKTNAASPVFYQLDDWHEAKHPYRWIKDFNFEGELFDNTNTNAIIKTSVPAGTTAGDYTNYTSYVTFTAASQVVYNFQPRMGNSSTMYLWVRARSKTGTSTGFNVTLNGGSSNTFDCIKDTNWVWYRFNTNNAAVTFSGLTASTNYQLAITASNTSLEIDKIAITSNSGAYYGNAINPCTTTQATITAGGSTTFCQGGSVTLTASNGSAYQWSNGATSKSITVTTSGSYVVTVTTTGVGSSTSSPVSVTVLSLPTATVTAGGPTTFCQGGTVTLTGSAGSSWLWTPGNQTSQAITVSTSGTYSVRVTGSNGCTKVSSNANVTVNSIPTSTITAGGATTFCQGGSVNLSASTGSSYLWSPGNQTTQTINVTAGGSYTVRVTNSNGCTKVSSATSVTVNALPTATITPSGSLSIPSGGNVTLTSSTGTSYLWSPGNQTTKSITVNTAGSYSVRVTNSAGCTKVSSPAVVTIVGAGTATITPSGPTTFCQGGSVSLSANTGTSYLWSNGATTKTITVSTSGSYTVTVYNGATPSVSPATTVTVLSLPTATISASGPTTFCSGGSVTLTSSANAGYLWSPGNQTSQSITASASGTYNVVVTGSNGCTKAATAVPVTVTTCGGCSAPYGLVTTNVNSNSATVSWTNPNSGQTQFQVKLKNMTTNYLYITGKVPATTTTITVGAASSSNYRWWVRSWCGTSKSAYAGYLTFNTPAPRTDEPELNEELTPLVELFDEFADESVIDLDKEGMQLYPNPASTSASITFKSAIKEDYSVQVLDFNGKVLINEIINAGEGYNIYEINTSHLAKGIYMVHLKGTSFNEVKRLAVQ
jgi:hypothetical protein